MTLVYLHIVPRTFFFTLNVDFVHQEKSLKEEYLLLEGTNSKEPPTFALLKAQHVAWRKIKQNSSVVVFVVVFECLKD